MIRRRERAEARENKEGGVAGEVRFASIERKKMEDGLGINWRCIRQISIC